MAYNPMVLLKYIVLPSGENAGMEVMSPGNEKDQSTKPGGV